MKIKTSKLTGHALDWAVAKAAEMPVVVMRNPTWAVPVYISTNEAGLYAYSPSTNWAQGGPIIEREGISLIRHLPDRWVSEYSNGCDRIDQARRHGPTPLIAAMRCLVASKLGDEVEVPDELCS